MALYIVEKVVDGVMLLDLRGRITLGPETEAVRSKLKQLLNAGQHRIILNLGEITYVDSVGLSTLVAGLYLRTQFRRGFETSPPAPRSPATLADYPSQHGFRNL